MKSKQAIEERLAESQRLYCLVSDDTIDPERESQIRELKWVLSEDVAREQRLKTIAEDARRDRELRDRVFL